MSCVAATKRSRYTSDKRCQAVGVLTPPTDPRETRHPHPIHQRHHTHRTYLRPRLDGDQTDIEPIDEPLLGAVQFGAGAGVIALPLVGAQRAGC